MGILDILTGGNGKDDFVPNNDPYNADVNESPEIYNNDDTSEGMEVQDGDTDWIKSVKSSGNCHYFFKY